MLLNFLKKTQVRYALSAGIVAVLLFLSGFFCNRVFKQGTKKSDLMESKLYSENEKSQEEKATLPSNSDNVIPISGCPVNQKNQQNSQSPLVQLLSENPAEQSPQEIPSDSNSTSPTDELRKPDMDNKVPSWLCPLGGTMTKNLLNEKNETNTEPATKVEQEVMNIDLPIKIEQNVKHENMNTEQANESKQVDEKITRIRDNSESDDTTSLDSSNQEYAILTSSNSTVSIIEVVERNNTSSSSISPSESTAYIVEFPDDDEPDTTTIVSSPIVQEIAADEIYTTAESKENDGTQPSNVPAQRIVSTATDSNTQKSETDNQSKLRSNF